jgi:hypothetical protein
MSRESSQKAHEVTSDLQTEKIKSGGKIDNLIRVEDLVASNQGSKKNSSLKRKESHHRHPKVCASIGPDNDINKSRVLTYRPQDKPAALSLAENYKYHPKAKVSFEVAEIDEAAKVKNQTMIQSVILRKEAIKQAEESHQNGRNKWALRLQSQDNSFQTGPSSRQTFEQPSKNQPASFGLVDSHQYSVKPAQNFSFKNSSLVESKVHHTFEVFPTPAAIVNPRPADREISAGIGGKPKGQYKNYLDTIISENDKLIDKIAKRLQAKEQSKASRDSNSTYVRSSFLRPSEAKAGKGKHHQDKDRSKNKQHASYHFDHLNGSANHNRVDSRANWVESRSVEHSYGVGKQRAHCKTFEAGNSVQPQVINSLQQRRALAKFLKKIK